MISPGLLSFLKRWWPGLLLGSLLAGAAGYVVAGLLPPVYEATATLLVSRGSVSGGPGADDPAAAESLGRTYAEALRTRPVLEEAARRVGATTASVRELQQAVSVKPISGTQLLRMAVDDRDPRQAANLANAVVAVFSEQNSAVQAERYSSSRQNLEQLVATLRSELDSRGTQLQQLRTTLPQSDPQLSRAETEFTQLQATYSDSVRSFENLRIAEASGFNGVTVVEPAIPPLDPVRPSKWQSVLLGMVAGLALVAATAKLVEYLNDGLHTRERMASVTGLRALGSIPRWRVGAGLLAGEHTGAALDQDATRAAEGYRLLFSTLVIGTTSGDEPPKTLMVTSAATDEGKSLTAANLAGVFAEAGRRTILVDADVHRASQMRRFALPNRAGFSTLLLNPHADLDSVLRPTSIPGLRVLTAGPAPAASSALYTSPIFDARLAELCDRCDVVVFDTPPVLAKPDASLLSQHMDGVLFVVDALKSRGRQVRRALELLNEAGAVVVGAAFNRVPPEGMDYIEYSTNPTTLHAEEGPAVNSAVNIPVTGEAT